MSAAPNGSRCLTSQSRGFRIRITQPPGSTTSRICLIRPPSWLSTRLSVKASAACSAQQALDQALDHPDIVDEYLRNEVRLGRVAGPFRKPPFPYLHVSSFGVIPKSGQPGKWRLIVDLSSPDGLSVNDGIDADSFSLQYIKVDDIIRMVDAYGPGALMAKFDVLAAFRNIAIHPADRPLLGMMWHGEYYVDLALPFGLRSAPFIFDSVASLVE